MAGNKPYLQLTWHQNTKKFRFFETWITDKSINRTEK